MQLFRLFELALAYFEWEATTIPPLYPFCFISTIAFIITVVISLMLLLISNFYVVGVSPLLFTVNAST